MNSFYHRYTTYMKKEVHEHKNPQERTPDKVFLIFHPGICQNPGVTFILKTTLIYYFLSKSSLLSDIQHF